MFLSPKDRQPRTGSPLPSGPPPRPSPAGPALLLGLSFLICQPVATAPIRAAEGTFALWGQLSVSPALLSSQKCVVRARKCLHLHCQCFICLFCHL